MKKNILFLAMLSVILLGSPLSAFAGGGCCAKMGGGGNAYCLESKFFGKYDFIMENRKALELTDDQMKALKNIKYTVEKSKVQAKSTSKITVLDMYHEIYQGEGNIEALNGLVDEKLEGERKLGYALVKGLLDFKNLLSEGQNRTLKDLWLNDHYSHEGHGSSCCAKMGGGGGGDGRCMKG